MKTDIISVRKVEYKPSIVEGYLGSKLSLDKPESLDLSNYALSGNDPLAERIFSQNGAQITYQRWFKEGLEGTLKKSIKKSDLKTLADKLNDPKNFWEVIDFSNSVSGETHLYFYDGKLNHTDIWKGGMDILEDGVAKATGLDIGFVKELSEPVETFEERLKKVEALSKSKIKPRSKEELEEYCQEHKIPEIVAEQHKYSGGYSIKNNVIAGYLLSSRRGEPFDVMAFINYLRKNKMNITDKSIVTGFIDATTEGQEYFISKRLKNAENIGRELIKVRIEGEEGYKGLNFTGKDKLKHKFKEAINYIELLHSDEDEARYITSLLDGIFLETLKTSRGK